ncbi:MAG: Asp23/Gls24 family envelope stress response protein [Eubacteriaceae bacterium]|nr:Asp23/Gls24 family envelope stress response protein [Eubacteriaceae bacterium]
MEKENEVTVNDIKLIAGNTAKACFGVVGMANTPGADGIVHLLSNNDMTKGVKVSVDTRHNLLIDLHVILEFGVRMETVAENLTEAVKYNIEIKTGLKVRRITVYVPSVRI